MNMKIIKSSKGEIHRISNNTVVQRISDEMLGIIRNNIYGDRNIINSSELKSYVGETLEMIDKI